MNLTGVMDYPLGSAVVIPRMVTFLSYDWLAFDLQRTILATWHRFAFKGNVLVRAGYSEGVIMHFRLLDRPGKVGAQRRMHSSSTLIPYSANTLFLPW